ncbi:MAG: hypothetical protein ABH891_07120 [Candidatus Omnitrophota bacterium]
MKKMIVVLLAIAVLSALSSPCFAEADYQIKSNNESSISALSRPASSYTLTELASLPKIKTMGCSITVKPDLTKEQYKKIIDAAILDIRNKDSEIDRIHMLVYDTDPEAVGSFNVAMVLWCPAGNPGSQCAVTADIAASNDRSGYETKVQWADKYDSPAAKDDVPPLENENGILVGRWFDEWAPSLAHRVIIRKKGGKYIRERKFRDGSGDIKELFVKNISGEERLYANPNNSFGDYVIIAEDGTLKAYDSEGFIYTAQPQK